MAIFGTKKEEKKAGSAKKSFARAVKLVSGKEHEIIRAPWFSEKAFLSTEKGVYAFEVGAEATKAQIAGAIKAIYNVQPKQIRVLNVKGKAKMMRNRRGVGSRAGRRKAYVYLNAGDSIQLA